MDFGLTSKMAQLIKKTLFSMGVVSTVFAGSIFSQTSIALAAEKVGRETGLPIPRFVSLKANTVNLRVGPGRKYAIDWNYRKKGLPVEVIQEFDQWRRIRDSQGTTGWVLHSLLSSRRTAIVAPWEVKLEGAMTRASFIDGKSSARTDSGTVARLQAGLLVSVDECEAGWCELKAQNISFWMKQEKLWGVYPDEALDG